MRAFAVWRPERPADPYLFASEGTALAAVRLAMESGADVRDWCLIGVPKRGAWGTIAEGDALVAMALRGKEAGT